MNRKTSEEQNAAQIEKEISTHPSLNTAMDAASKQ
jgi:hypothetical protein